MQLNIGFVAGLGVGVFPYIPGDLVKIAIVCIIGPKNQTCCCKDKGIESALSDRIKQDMICNGKWGNDMEEQTGKLFKRMQQWLQDGDQQPESGAGFCEG